MNLFYFLFFSFLSCVIERGKKKIINLVIHNKLWITLRVEILYLQKKSKFLQKEKGQDLSKGNHASLDAMWAIWAQTSVTREAHMFLDERYMSTLIIIYVFIFINYKF